MVTTSSLLQEIDGHPQTHVQLLRAVDGVPLINELDRYANVVHVASTEAAALEVDWYGEPYRPSMRLPLFLPADGWREPVRLLIGLAERIVVWADSKTAGLVDELALLAAAGREQDTVVLLEKPREPDPVVAGLLGAAPGEGEPLTADDPLLAGFPTVLQVSDVLHDDPADSAFLRMVLEPVYAVGRLTVAERVARLRGRIDTARGR